MTQSDKPWVLRYRPGGAGERTSVYYRDKETALRDGERLHTNGIPSTLRHHQPGKKVEHIRRWAGAKNAR